MIVNLERSYSLNNSKIWDALAAFAKEGTRDNSNFGDVYDAELAKLPSLPGWAPLVNVYQALWRIDPVVYFERMPFYPTLHLPLLLLCHECVSYVASSHIEIPLGVVRATPPSEGGIQIENDEIRLHVMQTMSEFPGYPLLPREISIQVKTDGQNKEP